MRWIEKLRTTIGATQGDVTVALFASLAALTGFFYVTFIDRRSPAEEGRELRLLAMRHDSVMLALRQARLAALGRRFGGGMSIPELALPPLDSATFAEAVEEVEFGEHATAALGAGTSDGDAATTSDTLQLGTRPVAVPPALRADDGPPRTPLDLNAAPLDQLERLPGVGEVLAGRIAAYRQHQRFGRVEDVMKVKGIGEGKFAKMRPYITVR